jgi:predicted PurR-regulated permease PerM
MESNGDDLGETTVTIPDPQSAQPDRFWWRVGGLLLVLAMLYLVWRIVEPLWQPVVWALLLGALLSPLNEKLTVRLGNRRRLGSSLTTALTVLLFVLPVTLLAAAVAVQASHLVARIDALTPDATGLATLDLAAWPILEKPVAWIAENAHVTLEQLQGWVLTGTKRLLEALAASGGTVVMGAVGTVVSFVLMLFMLFFVLRDGPAVASRATGLLPIAAERRERALSFLTDVTRAVFVGIGATALVQGALVGLAFWITGLPSPLVFGVLAALFALVPVVGTTLVWVPAAIYLATLGEYWQAIFMAAWGTLVVGMVDNFLRPMLISGRAYVPTLAVFLGVMGGLSAFGFIGLFVGPIVLSLVVAWFRFEAAELSEKAATQD